MSWNFAVIYNIPISFWKFVQNTRSGGGIPNTISLDDTSVTGSIDVTNLFSEFFVFVYTSTITVYISSPTLSRLLYDLPRNCYFSINDVEYGLSKLRGVSDIGPNGLPGDFLFNFKSFFAYPLLLLFKLSLDKSTYPDLLKLSLITPILEKGDFFFVNNDRSISIMSHLVKLFESLVLRVFFFFY